MARWPKVPGGGVKGKNSPIYWVRMHNQDLRNKNRSAQAKQRSIEKFNDRWHRLCEIHEIVDNLWYENIGDGDDIKIDISSAEGSSVDEAMLRKYKRKIEKSIQKVLKHKTEAKEFNHLINENIDTTGNGDLSKYATRIKNFSLAVVQVLIDINSLDNDSVQYIKEEKTIYIDGEDVWYLG